jgi:hypothetical protein
MNNIYNNELEKEDDWGWFIRLDLDNTTPTTNTKTKTNYICKILQTIDENKEYYDINFKSNPTKNPNPTKNTYFILKTKYDFFKSLLIYGLFYNCIYLDQIYKYINPFSCYKHKTCN